MKNIYDFTKDRKKMEKKIIEAKKCFKNKIKKIIEERFIGKKINVYLTDSNFDMMGSYCIGVATDYDVVYLYLKKDQKDFSPFFRNKISLESIIEIKEIQ